MNKFIILTIALYFIPLLFLAITFHIIKYITNKNKSVFTITPHILYNIKTFAPIPLVNTTFAIILTSAIIIGTIINLTSSTYDKIFNLPKE